MDPSQFFHQVDRDRSGSISAKELQDALANGLGTPFDISCVSLMISLFDRDNNGTIDVQEFCQLYRYICQWKALFEQHDRDRSGTIDFNEFSQALNHFGYRLNPGFIQWVMQRFDRQKRGVLGFDKYIYILVCLQTLTRNFSSMRIDQWGNATMSFEQFLAAAFNICV